VECMGACGGAPMMAIGDTFFERINTDEALQVLNQIKTTGTVPTPRRTVQLPDLSPAAND
jgi:hypothetical protein